MRSWSVLVLVVVVLWSAAAWSQPAASSSLPVALRARVKGDRFQIVTSVRGLPLGVRDALQGLFKSQVLDIADPGLAFRISNAGGDPGLLSRRLASAACSNDYCIVYYERGGTAHTWHVALFAWSPEETQFEWGGIAPAGLKSIDAVRSAMLSGAIKGGVESW